MRRKITKKEIFITAAVLMLSGALFLVWRFSGSSGKTAVITIDSHAVKKIDLSSAENGEFTLRDIEGVIFEIQDGRIRVRSSDCPDKICEKTGFISKTNERIICMPKRLVIEIEE